MARMRLLDSPAIDRTQTHKMGFGMSTRQRQSKVTFRAGAPLASHVKTLISTSTAFKAPVFTREWVTVRKHGVIDRGVATTLMGSWNRLAAGGEDWQMNSVSLNTRWPLLSVVAKPLMSSKRAGRHSLGLAIKRFRRVVKVFSSVVKVCEATGKTNWMS